jgi:hypothetical protein
MASRKRNPSPSAYVRVALSEPGGDIYWYGTARKLIRDNAGDPDTARELARAIAKLKSGDSVMFGGGAMDATLLTRLQDAPVGNPSSGAKQRARGTREYMTKVPSRIEDPGYSAVYAEDAERERQSLKLARQMAKRGDYSMLDMPYQQAADRKRRHAQYLRWAKQGHTTLPNPDLGDKLYPGDLKRYMVDQTLRSVKMLMQDGLTRDEAFKRVKARSAAGPAVWEEVEILIPKRNPSSGAKQRARGTRGYDDFGPGPGGLRWAAHTRKSWAADFPVAKRIGLIPSLAQMRAMHREELALEPRPALPNPAAATMHLIYLPTNAAWAFLWHDQLTGMNGQMLFPSRAEAVHEARMMGLSVSRDGVVTVAKGAR